jgi:hypothetical protein
LIEIAVCSRSPLPPHTPSVTRRTESSEDGPSLYSSLDQINNKKYVVESLLVTSTSLPSGTILGLIPLRLPLHAIFAASGHSNRCASITWQ